MACKWCKKGSQNIQDKDIPELTKDYNSKDERRMCSGCRDAITECIKEDMKKLSGE